MARKKTFHIFREAKKRGAYDDMPMLPDDNQVQLHLSRNDRPQPFFLVCEKDTLLLLMSGGGAVEFKETSVARFPLKPGDCVYVPAGAPHRIVPEGESVMLRFKAREPGLEAMAWYCAPCGAELHRDLWDTAEHASQDRFAAAAGRFSADERLRRCAACGAVHPPLDLAAFRWTEAAVEARAV